MKWRIRAFVASVLLVGFVVTAVAGCGGPDNPTMKEAPPPPPPKEAELKVPKVGGGKATYGSSKKYQDAFKPRNAQD